MGFEINDVMSQLGLSRIQADALDEIDGNKDGDIKEDVFSMAKKLLDPNTPEGHNEIINNDPVLADKVLTALNRIEDKDKFYIEDPAPREIQKPKKGTEATEIRPQDLDYSLFKKEKAEAYKLAERALNEVKDIVREFNSDFPYNPYQPNYKDFPKPEEFAQFKKDAFAMWERAVDAWVEDCKQDMVSKKSTNLEGMANGLANRFSVELARGKFEVYTALGLTLQRVEELFYQVGGNLESLEVAVRKEAAKIRTTVQENGEQVKAYVEEEAVKTRNVDTDNHKETQEINALSDAISASAAGRLPDKIASIEDLKNKIINSENINHDKKVELLTELSRLVITEFHVSDTELSNILRETRTISL